MRTKPSPLCFQAACSVALRCAGFQSTVCATNEALVIPSVAVSGSSGGRKAPRGCVFVFIPRGVVGDVCFLVSP